MREVTKENSWGLQQLWVSVSFQLWFGSPGWGFYCRTRRLLHDLSSSLWLTCEQSREGFSLPWMCAPAWVAQGYQLAQQPDGVCEGFADHLCAVACHSPRLIDAVSARRWGSCCAAGSTLAPRWSWLIATPRWCAAGLLHAVTGVRYVWRSLADCAWGIVLSRCGGKKKKIKISDLTIPVCLEILTALTLSCLLYVSRATEVLADDSQVTCWTFCFIIFPNC